MKIGIEIKPFNSVLRFRRQELGLSQVGLARLAGVTPEFMGRVETLKMPLEKKFYIIRNKLNRIAQALELDFDYLFPQDYLDAIQHKILPKHRAPMIWVREVSIESLPLDMPDLMLPEPDIDSDLLSDNLQVALSKLPDVESGVIKMRFGFEDNDEMTMEQVASSLGVSRERVRQIEARALRRLRHPNVSRKLRWFLE